MNYRTMLALDKALDAAPTTAAGVQFITPEGLALFLKRSANSDHPGTWAWPGGGIEANETPEEAARREATEETGYTPEGALEAIDQQTIGESAFQTFSHRVANHFLPQLNGEHSAYAWAPLSNPPMPLHPGVEATLKKSANDCAEDGEFKEGDHPRDDDGKFGSGGNSSPTENVKKAIKAYTAAGGAEASSHKATAEQQKELAGWLNSGVYEGAPIYRGIGMSDSQWGEFYDKHIPEGIKADVGGGEPIEFEGLTSWTKDKSRRAIYGGGQHKVLFQVSKIKGRDIEDYSHYKEEKEVLGAPMQSFKVVGWDTNPGSGIHIVTLEPIGNKNAKDDHFAFDRATVRRIDPSNGHLHVALTNISKANVCPYLGKEIPDWQTLELDPDKVYMLYRDPEELARAVPTFNNLPLLSKHVETTADDHKKDFTIGSTGTDARFAAPYLQNSLVIWDGPYIEMVEDESQKELSSAYRYRADMTPGEVDGVKFDGVMRDIIGNHVALVKEGRAGSDVVVGDSTEELNMSQTALSLKAVMARGALSAFLAPKLAQDAKIPLTTILNGVTAKNFAAKKPLILKNLNDALKGKLAKDESAEGLKTLLDALEGAPVVDDADPMEDASFNQEDLNAGVNPPPDKSDDDPSKGIDGPMDAIMEFLKGKLSPEDMAQIEAMCKDDSAGANDDPPPFEGMPKKPDVTGTTPPAKDKEMVSKEDAEKMVKGASDAVRKEVIKNQQEIREAEKLVKPYVGDLAIACDSAVSVLKTALGAMDVEGVDKVNDINALTIILKQQPLPGTKQPVKSSFAMDAAAAKTFAERHPGAARIKTL